MAETPFTIIEKCDGMVSPGCLMAVMGASGSGKTTLINALSFHKQPYLVVEGNIMLNGRETTRKKMANLCAYLHQDNVFFGGLTVREHLWFHAQLRLTFLPTASQRERVDELLAELGLSHCQNTLIGEPDGRKGISGGEAKRLSIACEFLTKPLIIFCDEPTTGLDAHMARHVIQILKQYAKMGRTILCSIHQPSSETFELFDNVTLLWSGFTVFLGTMTECIRIYEESECPCPPLYNPADHYINTLSSASDVDENCNRDKVLEIREAYLKSPARGSLLYHVAELTKHPGKEQSFDQRACCTIVNIFLQYGLLLKRHLIQEMRQPQSYFTRLLASTGVSLIGGALWWNLNFQKDSIAQNAPSALYFMLALSLFTTVMLSLAIFPFEYAIVKRDYQNKLYKMPVYYFVIATVCAMESLLNVVLMVPVFYFMTFQDDRIPSITDNSFLVTLLGSTLVNGMAGVAFGMSLAAWFSSFHSVVAMATAMMVIFQVYSGFVIPASQIPAILLPLSYFSLWHWAFELNMMTLFDGMPQLCPQREFRNESILKLSDAMLDGKEEDKVRTLFAEGCSALGSNCTNVFNGSDILHIFGILNQRGTDWLAISTMVAGYHLIGVVVFSTRMWLTK